jgi:hypothetical protein
MITKSAIVATISTALSKLLKWLITTAIGKAIIKQLVVIALLALFTYSLAQAGMLPRSPLAIAIIPLTLEVSKIPYMNYVGAFVPVEPIMSVLTAWIGAVITFHTLKVVLRMGKIIK